MVIELVILGVVIAFEGEFDIIETIAHIDNAGLTEPFYRTDIFSITGTFGNLGNLILLILFCQKSGYVVIDCQNLSFVGFAGIFGDILLVVFQELALQSERTLEVAVIHKHLHHFRHTAQGHIFTEELHHSIQF